MVMIVAITLGNITPNNAETWTADYNDDGVIDILDVVAIRSCIIDGNCLYRQGDSAGSGGILITENESLGRDAGESMIISVDADVDIAGLQFELTYDPSVEQFVNIEKTVSTANLELNYKEDNGNILVVLYSIDNNLITTGLNEILTVNFSALGRTSGDFNLDVGGILLVDEQGDLLSTIAADSMSPDSYGLISAYPNPFNPTIKIGYELPVDSRVSLTVYDIEGRVAAKLVDAAITAGYHSVNWDASANASGLYFVKLTTPDYSATQKLMLLK